VGRACSTNWGEEKCMKVNCGKDRKKKRLGRSRCRWVDIIKIDVGKRGLEWYRPDCFDSG
jgi:hypothetical protein